MGTPQAQTGVLGLAGTSILFGGEPLLNAMRSGGRLTGGFWWTPEQFGGIEANYFELHQRSSGQFANPTNPLIARPFFDIGAGAQSSVLVAYPNVQDGSIYVDTIAVFSGAEALLRRNLRCGPKGRVDLVYGYRFSRLADQLSVFESLDSPPLDQMAATQVHTDRFDLFDVQNDFHGGEIGLIGRWRHNYWTFQVVGKGAIGSTAAEINIDGSTTTTTTEDLGGGQSQVTVVTSDGGVLAMPTNMGTYRNGAVSGMGELGVSAELALTSQLRASVGYNVIYWSRVARVADQVDVCAGGGSRPAFNLKTTDFWAQGLNVGLEYQF